MPNVTTEMVTKVADFILIATSTHFTLDKTLKTALDYNLMYLATSVLDSFSTLHYYRFTFSRAFKNATF